MECSHTSFMGNEEFLGVINARSLSERIPLSGGINLVDRCNLDCVHCYIAGRDECSQDGELETSEVIGVIDQVVDAGCLFFLFTGGEPLLRSDFPELYIYAKKKGLVVSVFTNGTLIDDSLADMFRDWPPNAVEISIYGACSQTHDAVTMVPGSFEATLKGLERLISRGVKVDLKTIVMRPNLQEVGGMIELSEQKGVKFRMDAAIFPRFDGDKKPLSLRVSPSEAVSAEFLMPGRSHDWKRFVKSIGEVKKTESLYDCSAGISHFHITSRGFLQPCVLTEEPRYSILKGDFKTGWKNVISELADKKASDDYACRGCSKRLMCDSCPSFFQLENGDARKHSSYVCEIAGKRDELINSK